MRKWELGSSRSLKTCSWNITHEQLGCTVMTNSGNEIVEYKQIFIGSCCFAERVWDSPTKNKEKVCPRFCVVKVLNSLSHREQNQRMVWVGRHLTEHLIPSLCHVQGQLPLYQVGQSPRQAGLETLTGMRHPQFSWWPVPASHRPHSKEFLRIMWSKSAVWQFKAILPRFITTCPCQESLSDLCAAPFSYWKVIQSLARAFSCSNWTNSNLSACLHNQNSI